MPKLRTLARTVLLIACLTPAPALAQSTAASTSTTQARQTWEYAGIIQLTNIPFYSINVPSGHFSGSTMNEAVAKYLGRPLGPNETPLYVVIQALGADGFELVTSGAGASGNEYWFKRPAR